MGCQWRDKGPLFIPLVLAIKQKTEMCILDVFQYFLSLWLQVNSLQTVCTNVYKIFLLQAYRWAYWLHWHGEGGAQGHAWTGPCFPAAWGQCSLPGSPGLYIEAFGL